METRYLLGPEATNNAAYSIVIDNFDGALVIHDLTNTMAKDGLVNIAFDGDVTYVEGKTITLHYYYYYYSWFAADQVFTTSDKVLVDGGNVEFVHDDFVEWTYIEMTIEAGAFVDANGNSNEETVIYFEIAFNLNSYAGDYELTSDDGNGATTSNVTVEVLDEDNNTLTVPDGDGLVDYLELTIDTDNYYATISDERTDAYLTCDTDIPGLAYMELIILEKHGHLRCLDC